MFYSLRQLEDLHKANGANGHIVLPYRARLTPLASDWVKARRIVLGYSGNGQSAPAGPPTAQAPSAPLAVSQAVSSNAPAQATPPLATVDYLWWCDGPCGAAKAAVAAQARESRIEPLDLPAEPKFLVAAIKQVAGAVKGGRASGGILLLQTGAAALVYANRCPSLRAILGSCRDAVDQGVRQVAANLLIVEHPHQTLQQVRNLLAVFCRGGQRMPGDEVRRAFEELASCG